MSEIVYTPTGNLGLYSNCWITCTAGNPTIYLSNFTIPLTSANDGDLISISSIGPANTNYTLNTKIAVGGVGTPSGGVTPVTLVNAPSITLSITGDAYRISFIVGTDQTANLQSFLNTQFTAQVTPVLAAGMLMLSAGITAINAGNAFLKASTGSYLRGCANTPQSGALLTLGSAGVWDSTLGIYDYYTTVLNAAFIFPGTVDAGNCFQWAVELPFITNSTVEEFTTMNSLQKGVWMGAYGTGTNPSGGGTGNPPSSGGNLFHNFKHFGSVSVQYLDTTYGTNGVKNTSGVLTVKTLGTNVIPVGSILSTQGTGWGPAATFSQSLDGAFAYVSANSGGILTMSNLNGANFLYTAPVPGSGGGPINPNIPPATIFEPNAPYLAVCLPNMDVPIQISGISVSGGVATVSFAVPIAFMKNSNVPFKITDVMGMAGFIDGLYVIYMNSTGTGGVLYNANSATTSSGGIVISGGYASAAGNSPYYPSGPLNGTSSTTVSVPTSTPAYLSGGWAIKWTDPSVVPGAIWLNNCDDINISHGTIRGVRIGVGSLTGGWDSKFTDIHLWNQAEGFMLTAFDMGGKNTFDCIQVDTPVKFCFTVKDYGNTMPGCSFNQVEDGVLGGLAKCTSFVRLDNQPITGEGGNYNAAATLIGGAVYAASDIMLSDVSVAGMVPGFAPGFKRVGFDTTQGNILYEQRDLAKPPVGMRSKFRNGGLQTWARGTSISVPSNTWTITADGIYIYSQAVGTTVSETSPIGEASASLQIATSSSQGYIFVAQPLDADSAAPLSNRICTFQAKVRNNMSLPVTPQLQVYTPNNQNDFSSYQSLKVYPSLQTCQPGATTQLSGTFIGDVNSWKGMLVKLIFGSGNSISGYTLTNGGTNYTEDQYVWYWDGTENVTIGVAHAVNGSIASITITNPSSFLSSAPTIAIGNTGGGSGAAATVSIGASLSTASNGLIITDFDLSETPGELPWQIVPGVVWTNTNGYQFSSNPPQPENRLKSIEDMINRRWFRQKISATAATISYNSYLGASEYKNNYIDIDPPMFTTPTVSPIGTWSFNGAAAPVFQGITADLLNIYFESGTVPGFYYVGNPAGGGYCATCEFTIT